MQTYNVHCYHVVRSKFVDIEAPSPEAAIEATRDMDLSLAVESEDAEEVTGWLVDVVGDENYEKSVSYEADGKTREGLKYFYIRYEDDLGINWDLFVRAYNHDDAYAVWQEAYDCSVEGVGIEEVDITACRTQEGRGAVPWS